MNYDSKVRVFGNQLTSEKKYEEDNPRGDQMSVNWSSKSPAGLRWTSGLQMDRSVSVSVSVVFGLTPPPLSSGMEDESPLTPGSIPGTHTQGVNTHISFRRRVVFIQDLLLFSRRSIEIGLIGQTTFFYDT